MESQLHLSSSVREALEAGKPVVALESALISFGLPYPHNIRTALAMEEAVASQGAVPATIAVIEGRIRVGLTKEEVEFLARDAKVKKASRRDIPLLLAQGESGATTVSGTVFVAHKAGIKVMATGGIGGVHRGAPFDISADLPTIADTPVAVVCSGAKAILDLPATLEWLETYGVPIVGYGTDEFPAFYSRHSGLPLEYRVETPEEAARMARAHWQLRPNTGIILAVPVPAEHEMAWEEMKKP